MENLFSHLLDNNETIVKVLKPNKKAYLLSSVPVMIFFLIFFTIFFGIAGTGLFAIFDGDLLGGLGIAAIMFVLILVIGIVVLTKSYDNTWYAFTNKRVMIRTGIIGVNYRTMELKLVGSLEVEENFIDKMINLNTGSISFISPSNPVTTANHHKAFSFKSIENPYDIYKEIKQIIDQ